MFEAKVRPLHALKALATFRTEMRLSDAMRLHVTIAASDPTRAAISQRRLAACFRFGSSFRQEIALGQTMGFGPRGLLAQGADEKIVSCPVVDDAQSRQWGESSASALDDGRQTIKSKPNKEIKRDADRGDESKHRPLARE